MGARTLVRSLCALGLLLGSTDLTLAAEAAAYSFTGGKALRCRAKQGSMARERDEALARRAARRADIGGGAPEKPRLFGGGGMGHPPVSEYAAAWGKCSAQVLDLVDEADRVTRGDSSTGDVSMTVYRRGTVSIRLKVWSQGRDKFLAKIIRPSRLRGMATLKSGDNLWNYLPRMDRVVKLGSSMMGGSWMGSHFTNDDLVKETDLRKHYTCTAAYDEGDTWVVTLTPRADAPVVWGKLVMAVAKKGPLPRWARYYDERGTLNRTMTYEQVKPMGGRTIPTVMRLQPADAPSERTGPRAPRAALRRTDSGCHVHAARAEAMSARSSAAHRRPRA